MAALIAFCIALLVSLLIVFLVGLSSGDSLKTSREYKLPTPDSSSSSSPVPPPNAPIPLKALPKTHAWVWIGGAGVVGLGLLALFFVTTKQRPTTRISLAKPAPSARAVAHPPSYHEIQQIMFAAKNYAKRYGGTEDRCTFRFIKRAGNFALVRNYPKPGIQAEGAGIILKKIGNKWVGQDMGSDLVEWEEKLPALFR